MTTTDKENLVSSLNRNSKFWLVLFYWDGKYDKRNKSTMMRGIWVGEIWNIYCYQLYIFSLSLALPHYSQNHNQLLKHLLFDFKMFFDQIFVHVCFMGGFNGRCSYGQAVFSKFMPRIVLCGRPYDITASWQKNIPLLLNPYHSFKNHPLSTSSCSNLIA